MVGEVRQWLHELRRTDPGTSRQISDALDLLAAEGPTLGRPIVDRVKGSSLHHLKELRPGSARIRAGQRDPHLVRLRSR